MKSKKEIAEQFTKHKNITKSRLSKQYSSVKKCQSFYDGDMMSYEDTMHVTDVRGRSRKALVKFNKIKPYVNAVKGFMIQNRRKPKYDARIENNEIQKLFSKYANAVSDYVRSNAEANNVESQQDGDLLINGYGAVETALSYGEGYASTERDGEILMGRLDPLSVGWDPYARATNLLDAKWVYATKEYALEEALALFKDSTEDDFISEDPSNDEESADYEYFPYGGIYDKIAPVDWVNKQQKTVKVYFYQWAQIEKYYRVPNPIYQVDDQETVAAMTAFLEILAAEKKDEDLNPTAEILIFSGKLREQILDYFGDNIDELFEFNKKVLYTAVISGQMVFTAYKSISQQGFTIQFKTGDFDSTNKIWVGMVSSMQEPALYYNKALTELMYTIAANSKGGVFVESDAVEDIVAFEAGYNKTDAVIEVKEGALSGSKIQEKKSPQIATGLEDIIAVSNNSIKDVNGFDPTFMGSREFANDTALFQRQRIKQVTSLLANYFDSISLYQKTLARITLDLMRVFIENNEGVAVRVIGEDGQAIFLQLQAKQLSAEYDIVISESPLSVQDKQEQAQILNSMGDKIILTDPNAAKVIYSMAIDLMPLDYSMKEKIKEQLNPEQQPIDPIYVQQLEQQVQLLQGQQQQAQVQKTISSAKYDEARAAETIASIDKVRADTVKTLEEGEQRSLENDIVKRSNIGTIDINL